MADLFLIFWVQGRGLCLEMCGTRPRREKNLKNARKGRKPRTPHRKALLFQQRDERGPGVQVTVNLSLLF